VADVLLHPQPMVEVLAHHRDRWGHIERYDDFVDLLTFDRFDAEEWAELAGSAGAGYTVFVSKHHDGWSWWDAPASEKRLTEHGPKRNVLAEYAAACERHGVVFGTYFSLLDWGDERYPNDEFVREVLHPQVLDLVERFGTAMLWGDGHWSRDAGVWQTAALMDRVRAIDPDIVINDRWRASASDVPGGAPGIVRTYEYNCPDDIVDGPWELSRGIGHSFGYNRAERSEHHMTAGEIIDLYTEVLAKGGNLLLNIGPSADGTISGLQADPLRSAGTWIRQHDDLLAPCRPWTVWGDRDVRYLAAGDRAAGDGVVAIDLTGRGRFDALSSAHHLVTSVTDIEGDELLWEQSDTGLVVRPPAHESFPIVVCRVSLSRTESPAALFALGADEAIPLAPLLADARPGDLVQLGDGIYEGPAAVPAGVILRGLGSARTTLRGVAPTPTSIVPVGPTLTIGRNARVEHLHVSESSDASARVTSVSIAIDDDFATVLGCTVDGAVTVTGDDVLLRAISGRGVRAQNADRLHVSRCQFRGNRWDVGVELIGGGGQHIESSEFADHLCAVRLADTTGSTVRANSITARWWGVRLERTEGAHVHGNRVGWTMRAVDIDAGREAVVDGNAVQDGDSGCIVQAGAADCEVYGNHWDRCRVGLLAWDSVGLHHQDNIAIGLHESDAALVTGP
jgi:alpha-L-fucosidase